MSKKVREPYKLTLEVESIILEAIREGLTQRDASRLAGISEDTLCLWKRHNSEFSEKFQKSRLELKRTHLKNIQKASEKDWKASAWLLERHYKKEYSNSPKVSFDPDPDHPTLDFNMQAIVDGVMEKL